MPGRCPHTCGEFELVVFLTQNSAVRVLVCCFAHTRQKTGERGRTGRVGASRGPRPGCHLLAALDAPRPVPACSLLPALGSSRAAAPRVRELKGTTHHSRRCTRAFPESMRQPQPVHLTGTLPPLLFGTPLLNNIPRFDHVQLQKRCDCWGFWVICPYLLLAKLGRCYGTQNRRTCVAIALESSCTMALPGCSSSGSAPLAASIDPRSCTAGPRAVCGT